MAAEDPPEWDAAPLHAAARGMRLTPAQQDAVAGCGDAGALARYVSTSEDTLLLQTLASSSHFPTAHVMQVCIARDQWGMASCIAQWLRTHDDVLGPGCQLTHMARLAARSDAAAVMHGIIESLHLPPGDMVVSLTGLVVLCVAQGGVRCLAEALRALPAEHQEVCRGLMLGSRTDLTLEQTQVFVGAAAATPPATLRGRLTALWRNAPLLRKVQPGWLPALPPRDSLYRLCLASTWVHQAAEALQGAG
jgi:hypothetical protein